MIVFEKKYLAKHRRLMIGQHRAIRVMLLKGVGLSTEQKLHFLLRLEGYFHVSSSSFPVVTSTQSSGNTVFEGGVVFPVDSTFLLCSNFFS
jgi:hypothetical protein